MRSIIFLLAFLVIGQGCGKEPEGPKNPRQLQLPLKSSEVIYRNNRFGIDLFTVTAETENKNLMLSPLSASTALSMLLNGCSDDTYDQIRDMLGYEGLTPGEINATYKSLLGQLLDLDPEIDLALANAVWYRNTFDVHQSFLDTMNKAFDARIEALDFNSPSAITTINGWASDNTKGKIQKVIQEISAETVMFLMNALYFKGTWTYQFDKQLTAPASFYLPDGTTIEVETMKSEIPLRLCSTPDYTAAELTYGQQNFSMVLIEPTETLDEFLSEFDPEDWEELTLKLDDIVEPSDCELSLPKFRFDYERILNDQLASLGMIDAFMPFVADLSGISDESLFVSFVKQNTFIDVNEEGTEAAAVTTIGIDYTSAGPDPFIVDKPFVFAIRERTTGILLFIGKVIMPGY
ncbi:MAG TPA: serpin family protein [Bacteroidales bacterium]|nr:serpin family protein [Bacteroidales bacterium]